jgi:hypothetical protein
VKTRLVVLAIGAALLGAGCSSGSSGGSSGSPPVNVPTTHKPHTHTASPSPTATVTVTPTPTVTVTPPTALSTCPSSHLSLSLGGAQGTAGSTFRPIVLTNTSTTPCELHGYPGVSFVDAGGALLGKPAREAPGKEKTVRLGSGASAYALLQEPDPGAFASSACQPTTSNRLRVYPPGEKGPLFIKDVEQICTTKAGRTSVRPMAKGTGG